MRTPTETIARQLAIDTRLKLGLQMTEFFDVYRAIVSLRIACVKRPLESKISGATFRTDKVKIILVNSSKSLGHQNFTIAHELYHCLHDTELINRACQVEMFDRISEGEKIAELFAVHLLMPEDGIFHHLRLRGKVGSRLNLADVINLEQFFGVSRKAMCWRLEELKLISRQESEQYSTNVVARAKLLGKNTSLYKETKETVIISDYAEKAKEALEKGLITESRYREILADADLLDVLESEVEEADVAD
jgi:Zn-dependent peptidase ImmA (M78 family)